MDEGCKPWGVLESVLSNRRVHMNAKKCLYEGVIVHTSLYGVEAWGITSAKIRIVNVLVMKCLGSLVVVT